MNDSIDQLLRSPVSFLADSGPEEDIALSSRIRLARNLAGRPFPAAASLESRQEVCELVSQAAAGSGVQVRLSSASFQKEAVVGRLICVSLKTRLPGSVAPG